ncbi:hypothetical protein EKK58_05445 [Candidatus Dependentiae bacterium]|nr:MAG: hypothetical protein EKK58_05445 [Candidatus Dependentiae bacterium]
MTTSPAETTDNKPTIPAPPPLEGVYGTPFAQASESVFGAIKTAADSMNDPEVWKDINDTSRCDPFDMLLKIVTAYELACRGYIDAHKPILNIDLSDPPTDAGNGDDR